MDPATILLIGEILLKYGPSAARAFKDLFTKEDPTDADWQAVWDTAQKPWQEYQPKP